MEQSIIKDIRRLYFKSIVWTIIMSIFTIIISILIIFVTIERTANHSEKLVHKQSSKMLDHPSEYMRSSKFNEMKWNLKKNDIILNKFSPNGEFIDGSEKFSSLFRGVNVVDKFNNTHFYKGYYHLIQPIVIENQIKGLWVYSYQIKSRHSVSRYIMFGLIIIPLISPIIYFIIFSRTFINKLYYSVKAPLEELLNASNMIKNKNLEFNLSYNSNNEIGELTQSFRQMQGELKKSLYKNWQHDSEWAVMMSSLSHDLKTPVTLITLSTEMLNNMSNLTPNQQLQIDIINRNILKVNNILESMGQASNIKDPTLIYDVRSIDELIKDVENDFIHLIEKKNIQYEHDLKIDSHVEIPYFKVNRILENLFANSIQYTPENGEIHFFVKEKGNYIYFAIEDSGVGIEKEHRDLVFSKHFREDRSRSNSLGNAGLGLFITKKLVDELNGNIEVVDPLVLSGARIEFNIPYK